MIKKKEGIKRRKEEGIRGDSKVNGRKDRCGKNETRQCKKGRKKEQNR